MELSIKIIETLKTRFFSRWKYLGGLWSIIAITSMYFFGYAGMPKKLIFFVGIIVSIAILMIYDNLAKSVFWSILLMGMVFTFVSPVLDIPDELSHFARSVYISEGKLGMTDRYEELEVSKDVENVEQETHKNVNNALSTFKHQKSEVSKAIVSATSTYSFVSYIPQAFGWGIGRTLNLNLFWSFYLGRVMNLICYAFLAYLAVKISKKWEFLFAVLTIFPMSIYLAASYNQDGFSNGLIFVILALFTRFITESEKINLTDITIYCLLCSVMASCKLPYALLAGLLIFIKPSRYSSKKNYFIALIGVFITALIVIGWYLYFSGMQPAHRASNVNPSEQIQFIINGLPGTLFIIANAFVNTIVQFSMNFNFGWLSYNSPHLAILYLLYFGGIIFFFPFPIRVVDSLNRMGIVIVSMSITLAIIMSQYLTWSPVGSMEVFGVQGRYFIGLLAFLPLLLNVSNLFYPSIDNFSIELEQTEQKKAEREDCSKHSIASKNIWIVSMSLYFTAMMLLLTLSVYYKG